MIRELTNEMKLCRNRAFLRRCREVAEAHRGEAQSLRQIALTALSSANTPFYMTFHYAYDLLSSTPRRRRMEASQRRGNPSMAYCQWQDLDRKVKERMAAHPGLNLTEALEYVLCSGRTNRFYMSESYALRLLRRHARPVTSYRIEAV